MKYQLTNEKIYSGIFKGKEVCTDLNPKQVTCLGTYTLIIAPRVKLYKKPNDSFITCLISTCFLRYADCACLIFTADNVHIYRI